MAAISKPQTVSYTCYELGHTWTPSCKRASFDVALLAAKQAFQIYGSLFLIAGIVRRRGKSYFKKKMWREIAQSTLFLTVNGSGFIAAFCLWRKLIGRFIYPNTTLGFVPAAIGSFVAILIERKSRRGLLAVYMANVALETLWRMFEARGWVRSIPNGEVLLFSVASAGYLYYFKKPNGLPEGTLSIFKKFLGSDEVPEALTTETTETDDVLNLDRTETNDVLKAGNRNETEINDNLTPVNRAGTEASGITRCAGQRGAPVYRQALTWLQRGPSHATCRHKHSCIYYVLEGCIRMFGAGYVIQAAIKLVSSFSRVIRQPKSVIQALFNWNNTKLGAFLGCFVGIFKAVNCLLRWLRKRDDSIHGLLAGFLAGSSMMFYKGPTLPLYAATKLAEMLYFKGIAAGKLPYIGCADIIIYSISTAMVFHVAVLEPHNLRPAYWKFLLRVTGNKFATMNRRLLDPFVPNCSKLNPDYWPDYDPRYTDLAR